MERMIRCVCIFILCEFHSHEIPGSSVIMKVTFSFHRASCFMYLDGLEHTEGSVVSVKPVKSKPRFSLMQKMVTTPFKVFSCGPLGCERGYLL